jgi:hypothetical protein
LCEVITNAAGEVPGPHRARQQAGGTGHAATDEATEFFGAGQRFSLWNGADIGHGTISRRVYSEYGPC